MNKLRSAGLLMYRTNNNGLEVFLCHPGGPYYKNKHEGVWMIPKGVVEEGESHLDAAIREFKEETGFEIPSDTKFIDLGEAYQNKKKISTIWAFHNPADQPKVNSNLFQMEFPPRSGKFIECPEVDDGRFYTIDKARLYIRTKQIIFLTRLLFLLESDNKFQTFDNWNIK